MKYIKTLKIDIDKKNFEVIPSVQYDNNTRFLHIQLLNESRPFNITGCSVVLSGTKEDGNPIFNSCDIINPEIGFIQAEVTEQMNAIPGYIECEIKIYDGEGVLTSKKFTIKVTASQTSKVIESTGEFKALTEALSKVNGINNKMDRGEKIKVSQIDKNTGKFDQTYMTDEFIQQMAGNTPVSSIPANDSVTTEKIVDDSVTQSKIKYKGILKNKGLDYPFKNVEREGIIHPVSSDYNNIILDCKLYGGSQDNYYRIEFLSNGASIGGKKRYSIELYQYNKDWTGRKNLIPYSDETGHYPFYAATDDIETRVYDIKNTNMTLVLTLDFTSFKEGQQINIQGNENNKPTGYGLVLDTSNIIPAMKANILPNNSFDLDYLKEDYTFSKTRFTVNGDNNTINNKIPTGVYFVEAGVEGMPEEVNNSTCVLEVILCENRFIYQKIYKYQHPSYYFTRYYDITSSYRGTWNKFSALTNGSIPAGALGARSVSTQNIQEDTIVLSNLSNSYSLYHRHLISGDSINTPMKTGLYILEAGVEGMPTEFANSTCILEVTRYERFQFLKIYLHGKYNKYYTRYHDTDTNPQDWVLIDYVTVESKLRNVESTLDSYISENVTKHIIRCNKIGEASGERQRAYIVPLDNAITEDMIGSTLTFNMGFSMEAAEYIQTKDLGFKCGVSDTTKGATVGGVWCLTQNSSSRSSLSITEGIMNVKYTHTFTIVEKMVGALYFYVYETWFLTGDTTLSRDITIFNSYCNGKHITIAGYNYGCALLESIYPSSLKPIYGEIDTLKDNVTDIYSKLENAGTEFAKYETELLHRRVETVEKRNQFAWKPFDKAYVTLVFDDGRHDVDTVFNIFKEEGVACSLAIPSSWLGNRIDSGRTNIELVRELIQDPKNEFLGHSNKHTGITGNVTEDTVIMELGESQHKYLEYGLQVDGTMLAGARDHLGEYAVSNYDDAGWGYIARRYYKYGDNIAYEPQYKNPRKNFNQSLEKSKEDIDNAILNKTWLRYFAHTLDGSEVNLSEENLREYIRYVKSKGADKIEFITFRDMYNRFGTTELEKRLETLEATLLNK